MRRAIVPDIEQGIYPFKDIKLNRADVEWLLATHENGRGPVDWSDEWQRQRIGLDLRGADLREVVLKRLPLTRLLGGLTWKEWLSATPEQRDLGRLHLEGAILAGAHLEGAILTGAHLEGAHLGGAYLTGIALNEGDARLDGAHLEGANLINTYLQYTSLFQAHLEGADMLYAHLEGANLNDSHLEGADLRYAFLQGTLLNSAHMEGKEVPQYDLDRVRRWKKEWMIKVFPDVLPPTKIWLVSFDSATRLERITLGNKKFGFVSLVDIQWDGVNLSVVDWTKIKTLGDESQACQRNTNDGKIKNNRVRLEEYRQAVRANRQLATVLREQGLNEEASHYAYRAQKLQRVILRRQRKFGQYFFSLFLDMLAGYGYRPFRAVLWYLFVIISFATAYSIFGHLPLLPDTLVFSIMSFHGRGFFPSMSGEIALHNPLVVLAAAEAILGLLIEISFIATFTQRFFGR